jgi:hypothetical protein
MLIKATTGKENFPGAMSQFYAFVVPSRRYTRAEAHLGKAGGEIRLNGRLSALPAGLGLRPDLVGTWYSGDYEVPEGLIIKVYAVRSNGGLRRDAALLVQTRAQAAYRRIATALSGHQQATLHEAAIEGCFDFLSPSDAVREGVDVTPHLHKLLIAGRNGGLFTNTEVWPETASRVTVARVQATNTSGEVVTVAMPRRRRMIDV